mgnify:CR=1 FL=1
MEEPIVAGVATDLGQAKITVIGVPDVPGKAAEIFKIVAKSGANVDMIVQNVSAAATGRADISFTLPMKSHPGVTATFCESLSEAGINIEMISTSEIRISVVVRADDLAEAARVVHRAYGLDGEIEATVHAGSGR